MPHKKNITDHRPWGYYQILSDEATHKVKRMVVYPGKRLSLQRHKQRSEHWHIVDGEALVTVDDKKITLTGGGSVDIPKEALHRVENHWNSAICPLSKYKEVIILARTI